MLVGGAVVWEVLVAWELWLHLLSGVQRAQLIFAKFLFVCESSTLMVAAKTVSLLPTSLQPPDTEGYVLLTPFIPPIPQHLLFCRDGKIPSHTPAVSQTVFTSPHPSAVAQTVHFTICQSHHLVQASFIQAASWEGPHIYFFTTHFFALNVTQPNIFLRFIVGNSRQEFASVFQFNIKMNLILKLYSVEILITIPDYANYYRLFYQNRLILIQKTFLKNFKHIFQTSDGNTHLDSNL